jgi:hypothetical protein
MTTACGDAGGVGTCVDTTSDPTNCGVCGKSCTGDAANLVCTASMCVMGCPDAETQCGRTCVNTQTSNTSCGTCGNACGGAQTCTGGACKCNATGSADAGVTLTACGTACVDLQTNDLHCGSCGTPTMSTACGGGTSCAGGMCKCPTGETLCNGVCVNLNTSNTNCGKCGVVCTRPKTCTAVDGGTAVCQ